MQKKWAIPVLLVAVMVLSVAGSFAYFTATRTATSTVETGTLGILIAASTDYTPPADAAFGVTATPWNFDNMAPGDERMGCLWLMNTGTLGTARAYWDFTVLTSTPNTSINLADRLSITKALTTDNNTDWIPSMMTNATWNPNGDAYITLSELANYGGDWMSDVVPFVTTAPGGKGAICLTFKMIDGTPDVDNLYQGQTLTYQAVVTAQNPAH